MMINRRIEVILLFTALVVLSWGLLRAINRGETVVYSWTTYLMVGLLVCSAVNVSVRSKRLALIAAGICCLYLLIVIAAAAMSAAEGVPFKLAAVLRALLFFGCIGTASYFQIKSNV